MSDNPKITPSLKARHKEAVRYAQEYRTRFGDPIENLARLLGELQSDDELWQRIMDEPYGRAGDEINKTSGI